VFEPVEGVGFNPHTAVPPITASSDLEDLGTQNVGGVNTIGRRRTTVIDEGVIGNDRPVSATQEYWYSEELGVNLISKRQDPRFGMQNFEVSDIQQGDPDPKLFEVPAGSKIIDLRKPKEIPAPQAQVAN